MKYEYEIVPAHTLHGLSKPDEQSRSYTFSGFKPDFSTKAAALNQAQYKIRAMLESIPLGYELKRAFIVEGNGYFQVAIWYYK